MKLREDEGVPSGLQPGPWFRDDARELFVTTNPNAPTSSHPGRLWSPSTDTVVAFDVVDKVQKDHPEWRLGLVGENGDYGWKASISVVYGPMTILGGRKLVAVGQHASRELAICLCCLRAVGCPESEIETAMSERRRA